MFKLWVAHLISVGQVSGLSGDTEARFTPQRLQNGLRLVLRAAPEASGRENADEEVQPGLGAAAIASLLHAARIRRAADLPQRIPVVQMLLPGCLISLRLLAAGVRARHLLPHAALQAVLQPLLCCALRRT